MGHTTRTVPLIAHLLAAGHHVTVAGNAWQRQYLSATFPGIPSLHLDGYDVSYSRHRGSFMLSIFAQIPRLLKTIRREHQWLLQLTSKQHFDGIITDNRYGLYHPSIPSVIMTHQPQMQVGMGQMNDKVLMKIHYRMLGKYSGVWLVDVPGSPNLAGTLSHPAVLPPHATYIGLLSQMAGMPPGNEEHLLVLLSGPEPQRTILSRILWQQVQNYKGKVVFIEGSNDAATPQSIPPGISYYKRITKEELQPLIARASMVVCRSGYSSLMDLVAMDKKAILIPTPGQTEQEYLGKYLHNSAVFYSASQKGFDLMKSLTDTASFPFKKLPLDDAFTRYKDVVDEWVATLRQSNSV